MKDRYCWTAQFQDGTTISSGEDVRGAVVVSFVPETVNFPRHDFSGLKFVRRFCRGFVNALGGGMKEYVHCLVTESCRIYVLSTTGSVIVTPPDYELYL